MVALPTDEEGFLIDLKSWNSDHATEVAEELGIELTNDHWQVIDAIRNFYGRTGVSPSMRPLVNVVKAELGSEIGNSLTLARLFTHKTTRRIAQISGLPKPADCI